MGLSVGVIKESSPKHLEIEVGMAKIVHRGEEVQNVC